MIEFLPLNLNNREQYDRLLQSGGERGCEYSFVNLYLWGRQKAAFLNGQLAIFSQYNRKSVYLYPIGPGDKKQTLEALMADAAKRGIPCRFTGLNENDRQELERLFPGKFHFHTDRDSFDYIYNVEDLATLKGRKFQRKRNHLNRFREANPDHSLEQLTDENLLEAEALVDRWFQLRLSQDPHADYLMEQAALKKALQQREALGLEGLLLRIGAEPVAMTMGSRLSVDTFDVHFEKALDIADGAYGAINNGFARYLREKYPELRYLNREDDLGLEGLRKAKLSYNPDHLIEKSWACLREDGYAY